MHVCRSSFGPDGPRPSHKCLWDPEVMAKGSLIINVAMLVISKGINYSDELLECLCLHFLHQKSSNLMFSEIAVLIVAVCHAEIAVLC